MAGWETRRHSYFQFLGISLPEAVGPASKIIIDTYLHCLNAFKAVTIVACNCPEASDTELFDSLPKWKLVISHPTTQMKLISSEQLVSECQILESSGATFTYNLDLESSQIWKVLLPCTLLQRDTLHEFSINSDYKFTHLMLFGLPDGGIHRIGIY